MPPRNLLTLYLNLACNALNYTAHLAASTDIPFVRFRSVCTSASVNVTRIYHYPHPASYFGRIGVGAFRLVVSWPKGGQTVLLLNHLHGASDVANASNSTSRLALSGHSGHEDYLNRYGLPPMLFGKTLWPHNMRSTIRGTSLSIFRRSMCYRFFSTVSSPAH